MFDIFYSGPKPNLFAHEQAADSIEHAKEISRTRHFWWVNYLTDYTGFDFLWEPVPWEADQAHVWPSQHQANGGTMLVPKHGGTDINRQHAIVPRKGTPLIVGIDHGNGLTVDCNISTRFVSDYGAQRYIALTAGRISNYSPTQDLFIPPTEEQEELQALIDQTAQLEQINSSFNV